MTIFELKNKALNSKNGEFILGFQDTDSLACYMIYGILKPKEKGRLVKPGEGHEEIVLAVRGNLELTGFCSGKLKEGYAFHIKGKQKCYLENKGKRNALYIIAGGHSEHSHH